MRIVKRILKWLAIVVICVLATLQFVRPARTNPPSDQAKAVGAHLEVSPEVASILERSCSDCHSNNTRWPWYSNVAPVSWFLVDHVNEGRKHLNFSEWASYDARRQGNKLEEICDEVKVGAMPLISYTPLHPSAKLSQTDIRVLCEWAQAERTRLAAK